MSEMKKRIIMTIVGVLTSGLCVGLFNFSVFGMDPFQVFAHGVCGKTVGLEHFGTFYMVLNLIMLIAIFFLDKKKIGLGTVINIFFLGYVVQFSSWVLDSWIPNPNLAVRIAALVIGLVVLCLGASLYFTADLGVSTYDAVALILNEKTNWKFRYCRIGSDLICTLIGFFLGAVVGVGTLVTAFFMGPIIEFFNKKISIPLRYGKKEA
ncbi:MAG: YitT family protein [Lachnospiraceae bacterium]|nr:YitT family protein [Lachnospiraceae bacterium]